jgi:hypothetical protein
MPQVEDTIDLKMKPSLPHGLFSALRTKKLTSDQLQCNLAYLSGDVHIAIDRNGFLDVQCRGAAMDLSEGMQSARDEAGHVRGTSGEVFPAGGPAHKYSALFDPRPAFDALRASFMVFADHNSQANFFMSSLEQHDLDNDHVEFVSKVEAWTSSRTHDGEPNDFGLRAWGAYRECVK